MSIETLKSQLPDYAKDLKLNLSSLASETVLSEQQKAGAFVASALASRNSAVSNALIAEFAPKLSSEALTSGRVDFRSLPPLGGTATGRGRIFGRAL